MKKTYSFQEARRIARGHGFESAEEFLEYDCPGAYSLPKNVEELYRVEWKGWHDFLGIRLSYLEAKRFIHEADLNLATKAEYEDLVETRKRMEDDPLSRLPWKPDLCYKKEWINWNEWLGI